MNYDITMCNNKSCTKNRQCLRYLNFEAYSSEPEDSKPLLASMLLESRNLTKCNFFINAKCQSK